MQHSFDWDDFRMFYAVGCTGSLAAAAAELGLHRSTVLRRIERLEERLGAHLFDRTARGITLTAAGERLMPHAEKMADETNLLLQAADADHGRPAGNIRVAATFNLAFGLLPSVIARFREAYPEISVDLSATLDGYGPIHPDHFDIAFRTLGADIQDHENMIGRRLGKLQAAVYGARGYFAQKRKPKTVSDVHKHRALLGCGSLANIAAMRWFESHVKDAVPVYRASSMLLLLAAVRSGLGIACLPCYLCKNETDLSYAFEVPPEHCADLWVLRHSHQRDTARMRAFADFMTAEIPLLL